jgi:nucleotide-binding universal stress UspA family protein
MSANVLVPLDGSLLAERALPVAASLVKQRHGRLELALVHEPIAFDGFVDAPWSAMTESMQDRYVIDKAAQLGTACESTVGHALLHGDVAKEICKRAREVDAEVIVMSTHGRTGLDRTFNGSVADEVIRASSVPVLLLRQPAAGTTPLEFKRIVVPIDDSAQSREIFAHAAALALPGETTFVLLRVVPPMRYVIDGSMPYGYVAGPVDESATDSIVGDAEQALVGPAADLGVQSKCDVEPRVIVSDATGKTIVEYARTIGADLIAMMTHGRATSRLLLGSVTDDVLHHSDIPLLVLRPSPE